MLTIFAVPKPFAGHIGVTQLNAIRSWKSLGPECEIILMGNEDGTAQTAAKFGLRHIPDVAQSSFGTPLISDLFKKAQDLSVKNFFCYVNSDIILMSDFMEALQRVINKKKRFLIVGHRWNLDLSETLEFGQDWEHKLRHQVQQFGALGGVTSIDFFVFPRNLLGEIPPFVVGRPLWDNWMLYRARCKGVPLIDVTPVVMAVHQNHDYSHHPQGKEGTRKGEEALINATLAGGALHNYSLLDATHVLTQRKLQVPWDREHLLRRCKTLPSLYPIFPLKWAHKALYMSRPFRSRCGLTLSSFTDKSRK